MMMKYCTFGDYKKCLEFVSGDVRIVVTTEVGPRIIGCFVGDDDNMFVVFPSEGMKGSDTGLKFYGGHRFWHSPEVYPRTYQPDNEPVEVIEIEHGVRLISKPEEKTGLQKTIEIEALNNGVIVVTHKLKNLNMWDIEVAPWALSMMATGGMAVIPQDRDLEADKFTPDRQLTLWPYSSYADPRLVYGDDYLFLKQDSTIKTPIKIGFNDQAGWAGYVRNGKALIKYFDNLAGGDCDYPDGGCSVESYSCSEFCELETLGVLDVLPAGEEVEHVEYWQGIGGLPKIETEKDFTENVLSQMLLQDDGVPCLSCDGMEDEDEDENAL